MLNTKIIVGGVNLYKIPSRYSSNDKEDYEKVMRKFLELDEKELKQKVSELMGFLETDDEYLYYRVNQLLIEIGYRERLTKIVSDSVYKAIANSNSIDFVRKAVSILLGIEKRYSDYSSREAAFDLGASW